MLLIFNQILMYFNVEPASSRFAPAGSWRYDDANQ
jgi:hypothetical protein